MDRPVIVSLALDHEVDDVLRMAGELSRRLQAPLVPVHVLSRFPRETEADARAAIRAHLEPILSEGTDVREPMVLTGRAAERVPEVVTDTNAQMVVTGGGGPATVRRWLLGSTAEAIVRSAPCPTFVVRGLMPFGWPILCPVDLSPQSRVGLLVALRLARLFETSLTVLHVVEEPGLRVDTEELTRRVEEEEAEALRRLEWFLDPLDTHGVEIRCRASVGPPAQRIVEATDEAGLLVVGSRGFSLLRPGALGGVTERAVRFSRVSVLTVRDTDPQREDREELLRRVADLKSRGERCLAEGDPDGALPLLELATALAPANAVLQDTLSRALAAAGRPAEAEEHRRLASTIREQFT